MSVDFQLPFVDGATGRHFAHPSRPALRDFGLGMLSEAASAQIETHLEHCSDCIEFLSTTSHEDSLVDLVRDAHEGCSDTSESGATDTYPTSDTSSEAISIVGYNVFEELGRGGLGVVYRANHLRLNRAVALKVILAGQHASQDQRQRFRNEAETIARLKHPNIVQIYEVGEHQGHLYLSLELVEGGGLQTHTNRSPQEANWSAKLVEQLARAVHYAHQQGIVHRDLKPANVLLEPPLLAGVDPVAKISDFGLAKDLATPHEATQSGVVMGTPSYLAPEQASGNSRDITPQSDVYSLGAILYELLSGRPPFEDEDLVESLRMVREEEPAPPRRWQPSVPQDIQTVCLKCLEKDPGRRYASAHKLADDLQRFVQMEPINAQPASLARRIGLTYRRHRVITNLALVILLTITTGIGAYSLLLLTKNAQLAEVSTELEHTSGELQRQTQAAASAKQESQRSAEAAEKHQDDALSQRDEASRASRIAIARGLAAQSLAERDRNPPLSLLLARESYLVSHRSGDPILPVAHEQLIGAVAHIGGRPFPCADELDAIAINSAADLMATVNLYGELKLWDLRADDPAATTRTIGKFGYVNGAGFSRDGSRFAARTRDSSSVVVWELPIDRRERLFDTTNPIPMEMHEFDEPSRSCKFWRFGPDRRWYATFHNADKMRLWSLTAPEPSNPVLETDFHNVATTAFSPCGCYLVAANADGTELLAWDLTSKTPLQPPEVILRGKQRIASVKFSPEGTRLGATLERGQAIFQWNVSPEGFTSRTVMTAWRYGRGEFQFGKTGEYMITTGGDHSCKLWKLSPQGMPMSAVALKGWRDTNDHAVFSPDDAWLAAQDPNTSAVYVWDLTGAATRPYPVILRGHFAVVRNLWFASDGRLLSIDRTGEMREWSKEDFGRQAFPSVQYAPRTVSSAAYGPDGRLVVAPTSEETMLWDALDQNPQEPRHSFPEVSTGVAVSPDGNWMAQATSTGVILRRFNDIQGVKDPEPAPLQPDTGFWEVTFSPDSRLLAASAFTTFDVYMWKMSADGSPVELLSWTLKHATSDLAISPDGKLLAAAGYRRPVQLWRLDVENPADQEPIQLGRRSHRACSVAFNPQGGQVASATIDGDIVLWNLDSSGNPTSSRSLAGHIDRVLDIDFRHDGKQLASASFDKTVWLWDLTVDEPARATTVIREFDTRVWTVDYSPDGNSLTTGTQSGQIITWNLAANELAAQAREMAGRELTDQERQKYVGLLHGVE